MDTLGLSDTELTTIRSDVEELLPDTCTIQQSVITNNAVGEPVRTYSARAENVPCRIDPEIVMQNAFEYLGGFSDVVKANSGFRLTVAHDQTVEITDRVVCNGETYEVVAVDPGKSWKASTRATLSKVSP